MSSLLGNRAIWAYLDKAAEAKALPHTMLFYGIEGIGKSLFAKALALRLLNTSETRLANHPDLHLLSPESKSGLYPVEQIRSIIDEVHIPPFEAPCKVFIFEDADRMQTVSANALLKTLEEPHLDSIIILISSSLNLLLPTILSRCVQLSFQPLSSEEIAVFLQNNRQMEQTRAKQIARTCNGSLGHALRLLDDPCYRKVEAELFSAMEGKSPRFQAMEAIETVLADLDGMAFYRLVQHVLTLYLMKIRDLELIQIKASEELCFFHAVQAQLKTPSLAEAERRVSEIQTALERNIRFSACLEILLQSPLERQ